MSKKNHSYVGFPIGFIDQSRYLDSQIQNTPELKIISGASQRTRNNK